MAVGRAGEDLARGAEDGGEVGEAAAVQRREAGLGEVVAAAVHGAQHPLRHRRRAGQLQEMAAAFDRS
jgi:hypothetical protein